MVHVKQIPTMGFLIKLFVFSKSARLLSVHFFQYALCVWMELDFSTVCYLYTIYHQITENNISEQVS